MNIKPGIYPEMDNSTYHSRTEWWSSTQLKAFLPEHYKPYTGVSDALTFGTLVHELALEPEQAAKYVPLDAVAIGVKSDGTPAQNPLMTAAWKRAVAEVEVDGKKVVAQADWDRAVAMVDAIHDHPEAGPLIFGEGGANEESAFWIDDQGLQHKARFDRRIPGAIVDVKTTSAPPGAHSLTSQVLKYGYDLSAAAYMAVADGLGLDAGSFLHVWVEKVAPFRVTVTELDSLFLMRGDRLRDLALTRATTDAEPYEGATGRLLLTPPYWATDDDEMEVS